MMDKDYMSHNSYNGETAGARLRRFGYDWRTYAENIGWGSGYGGAPEYRLRAWMNSPGPRYNILNKNLREVGIGTATGYFGGYANSTAYTVDFGTRR